MDLPNPWWVTGLVDGHGGFTFSRRPTKKKNLALYFSVKLITAERPLLELLQRFFDGGTIYSVGPLTEDSATASKWYRVSDYTTLQRVDKHFQAYPPLGRRAHAFELWRNMLALKTASGRLTDHGRSRLFELADELSAHRNTPAR
jgi:hypothetical protein